MRAILTAGIVAMALAAGCTRGEGCDRMHRHARYAPVIAKVRSLGLKPGEHRRYRLADPADGATLRADVESPDPPRGEGVGTVWVETDAQGRLAIAIETIDQGHAGEYGFLYADHDAKVDGPGREWTRDCDLGGGWWSVSFNLD